MKPYSFQAIGITVLGLLLSTLFVWPAQSSPPPGDRFFYGKSRNPVTGDEIPTTIHAGD
jgi:hypothetical protein